ncbi:alcohol oxidase [Dacryopinax primogenitus]|uniref:Alcohol oxidase n=1 Tax=Dacryopinax primogenitus (strain DJM 731) TaxID=1858805 RepID=M5GEA2_DACPD|nr:alcohol oxidase [Dacryopinax primogenitus]EJU05212.1 alcohol oxidase [Dacryopinax primogenitus]
MAEQRAASTSYALFLAMLWRWLNWIWLYLPFVRFLSDAPYPEQRPEDVGLPLKIREEDVSVQDLPGEEDAEGVWDYIVGGGGTSGCALASRLSETPGIRVLLLERGPVGDNFLSRVPLISTNFARANSPNYRWLPQSSMLDQGSEGKGGKKGGKADMAMVSGKVLGGTSRINSMLYTRGAGEWEAMARAGRKGWSFNDVYPYFLKSERALGPMSLRPGHGLTGLWQTRAYGHYLLPSYNPCVSAAQSVGLPFIKDLNAPQRAPYGVGDVDVSMDDKGRRCSAYSAFVPAELVLERKDRFAVCTETLARKIVFQDTDQGPRAVGLVIEDEDEERAKEKGRFVVRARREVILCGGAIGSPQLLQLSGVGPAEFLKEKGVKVVKDLPGVGEHLQDHFGASVQYLTPLTHSFHALEHAFYAIRHILHYILFGAGIFLAPIVQISIFTKSSTISPVDGRCTASKLIGESALNPENVPDVEIMPIPAGLSVPPPPGQGGFSFLTVLATPFSFGRVRLASTDPRQRPACDLGVLSDERDWAVIRVGLKLSLALAGEMKSQGYALKDQCVLPMDANEEEVKAFVRRQGRTTYHYSSTCRMAPEAGDGDGPGVVDDELRVHGVLGLRVADASIFPKILSVHLQAPCVMVGEKCADMIKKSWGDLKD